jgi:hypothetical protein
MSLGVLYKRNYLKFLKKRIYNGFNGLRKETNWKEIVIRDILCLKPVVENIEIRFLDFVMMVILSKVTRIFCFLTPRDQNLFEYAIDF